MVLFGIVVTYALCTTFRTILEFMSLIDEQAVNTELFKGQRIVLISLLELVELFL